MGDKRLKTRITKNNLKRGARGWIPIADALYFLPEVSEPHQDPPTPTEDEGVNGPINRSMIAI
jgi:hypothetical protein